MKERQEMMKRPRRSGSSERVVAALKHSLAEGRYEGGILPSYRQIVSELNVTKASVEKAMGELEREGVIWRAHRRGVVAYAPRREIARKGPPSLQCINFVMPPFTCLPSFVEADYLSGYTELLEHHALRMRFVASNDLGPDYSRLFSANCAIESQGVVLINFRPIELMQWLQEKGVCFVVQNSSRYDTEGMPAHCAVYVNKSGGAFQAVNHLLELGHRRVGFVGIVERIASIGPAFALERPQFEGYCGALACAGLAPAQGDFVHCETKEGRESLDVAKAFLDRTDRPAAVLAGCDEIARSLLDAARTLGLRVPEDLSIIGFDNQPTSQYTHPPLTTVSVPRRELARSAVALLLDAAEKPDAVPETRILDTHLIIRGTTAPPSQPGGGPAMQAQNAGGR